MPITSLEAVRSSSFNISRQIWNQLPEEVAGILDPVRFKNAVKISIVYDALAQKRIVRKVELNI
jgi:hypothetical protein